MSGIRAELGRLFGRDGVVTVAVIVSFLTAWLPAFGWDSETTGAVSAALVAIGGFVSAALVSVDRALPALVGVGQAVIAAVLSFGVHLPTNWVSSIMAALAVIAGLATRPQVGAKQPPRDRHGNDVRALPSPIMPGSWSDARLAAQYWRDAERARDFPTDLDTQQGPARDAPPLPKSGDIVYRDGPETEVFPSVVPDAEQHGRHQERGRKGRHWLDDGWRPSWGQLRPDDGL